MKYFIEKILGKICKCLLTDTKLFDDGQLKYASSGTDEILIFNFPDGVNEWMPWEIEGKYTTDDPDFSIYAGIPTDLTHIVKVEFFRLRQIHQEKPFFVKEYLDKKLEFKNIPTIFLPQVFKHYFDLPLRDDDLVFFHEGQKAKFLEPIY